jgi:hypothetical protein
LEINQGASKSSSIYVALAVLAYIELDQIEKAELFFRTIQKTHNHVYLEECRLRFEYRKSGFITSSKLTRYTNVVYDHIHLEFIAGISVHENYKSTLDKLLNKLTLDYPKSPLIKLINICKCIEKREFEKAHEFSREIIEHFPNNVLIQQFHLALSCEVGGSNLNKNLLEV